MALIDDLADRLAADVMAAMDELDDDRFYMEVGKVIGTSSPSLEEAFMTSCRLRISEARARRFIEDRLAARRRDKIGQAG
ncbi:hypothetical protein [Phaeovulum sp. NW3]|uniref:hypothetical protein n=1 Tax=Phaeovulum sp. NW3 TaxID=2934933 RepID=UPI0020224E7D|nr:hypothetical protein [Phaeovulum sp. NW3]MCL7463947.1 hypothetical protein [Phaeovulum sp. NW3]